MLKVVCYIASFFSNNFRFIQIIVLDLFLGSISLNFPMVSNSFIRSKCGVRDICSYRRLNRPHQAKRAQPRNELSVVLRNKRGQDVDRMSAKDVIEYWLYGWFAVYPSLLNLNNICIETPALKMFIGNWIDMD